MEKLASQQQRKVLFTDYLRQFFWGTKLIALACILNITLFGSNVFSSDNVLFFRSDLVVFAIGVIATTLLHTLLERGHYSQAATAFFLLWALIMSYITWFGGGLYSPMLLSFMIIMFFAALFTTTRKSYLFICGLLLLAVMFLGFNHIYEWAPRPSGDMIEGIPRIIGALALTGLSAYVYWVFGRLLTRSFQKLDSENQNAIKTQAGITELANTDSLTGLLNRNGAELSYQALMASTDFEQECIVVFFIDLDNFKIINNLFDHYAGDQLLKTMAERIEGRIEGKGFACRFGGDEFVIAVNYKKGATVDSCAALLLATLAEPNSILGTEAEVTASIGIATAEDAVLSFNGICKKADIAMLKAKQSGKNKYHVYTDELQREYMRNLKIINHLKNATSKDLLDLYYQPKVNLKTNKVEGIEALLRWNRGNDESFGPEEFVPVIESTELIHSIGAWVINEACKNCRALHDAGQMLTVAVNISALQLTRSSFYQLVLDALEHYQLAPEYLDIEITEHSLLQEVSLVSQQLEALKNLGVGLTIDDFGTGYSNMSYLTRLQIDVLKLDRSFIANITTSEEYRVIVTAIIRMSQVLGIKVVAEGIETAEQRDILAYLDCNYGQGYIWSRAVPADELLAVVRSLSSETVEGTDG